MRRLYQSRFAVAISASFVSILAMATWAEAHGGDPAQLHGCKLNQAFAVRPVGDVRLIDPQASCHPNETPVDWAIQGPAGHVGPEGPPGDGGARALAFPADPGPRTEIFSSDELALVHECNTLSRPNENSLVFVATAAHGSIWYTAGGSTSPLFDLAPGDAIGLSTLSGLGYSHASVLYRSADSQVVISISVALDADCSGAGVLTIARP